MELVNSIPVRDANGDVLTVYLIQEWSYLLKVRRLRLCSGEPVKQLDDKTFQLESGERLKRVG